jgi:hypothetical protein
MSAVATVKPDGMASRKPLHHGGDRGGASSPQQVKMIGNQSPRLTNGSGKFYNVAQPFDETVPILIVDKYLTALDAPHDYMMQGAGNLYTGLSGHGKK